MEVVIDEGMRRWYRPCPCCLSDAYPELKRALDAETVQPNLSGAMAERAKGDVRAEGGDPACWAHLVCPECGAVGQHGRGCAAGLGEKEL